MDAQPAEKTTCAELIDGITGRMRNGETSGEVPVSVESNYAGVGRLSE